MSDPISIGSNDTPPGTPPVPSTYLVLDIETVPDADLYRAPEPPAGAEKLAPPPFPPLFACRPVLLGGLWLDESLACTQLGIIGEGKDEAGMLTEFAELMTSRRPQLVTWNGRSFDLPVLALRALRHGVSFPWYYQEPGYRHRYSAEGHLDLGDFLADHGAARMTSLDGAARLIGLPGKGPVDGSQVEALYLAGQLEALRAYCLSDVAQTAFVFLRYRLLAGHLDHDGYRRTATALLASIEADGRLGPLVGGIDRRRLLLRDD
jgi:predicted PolB exonuclease-like 3'-5' exonuclease